MRREERAHVDDQPCGFERSHDAREWCGIDDVVFSIGSLRRSAIVFRILRFERQRPQPVELA